MKKTIWTVGHSNISMEAFLTILNSYSIKCLMDVRRYPGSGKFPQFNRDQLEMTLAADGIRYFHLEALGGRRKAKADSKNTGWKSVSFRGYADYAETEEFKKALEILEGLGEQASSVYMCSEVLYWRCHRMIISDYLLLRGWDVNHILSQTKSVKHKYAAPASVIDGKLTYPPKSFL